MCLFLIYLRVKVKVRVRLKVEHCMYWLNITYWYSCTREMQIPI